ncbi:MAG TPA: HDOD domain-containing protein [Desulfobacter sp.]|nr:HDOD domain-containing protein [Desulfobacter sp.]
MKKVLYRIIVNKLVPDSIEAFSQILEKEFNYTSKKADDFVGSLPRILYESNTGSELKKALNVLKPANAGLTVHKLVKEENFPFYIDRSTHRLILKILNMTLRAGTDAAFVYMVAGHEDEFGLRESLIGREEKIEDSFRLSDFIFIIDENSLLFLGFATDNDGLHFLIPKLEKTVQGIMGKDAEIKFGRAVFPKDGYSLPDIMRYLKKNFGMNKKQLKKITVSDSEPVRDQNDILSAQLDAPALESFEQDAFFKDAKGVFFYKLLDLSPETVWSGVKNMTIKNQKRFMLRLPHDSKLVDYLSGKIKNQADVRDQETAREEIGRLAAGMHFEKARIERQRNRTAVVAMLNRIESLPVIPAVAMQVYQLSIDPASEIEDVQNVLSTDPGLAVKILKLVDAPFYGLGRKVDSIREGIVVLGMEEIAQLAFGLSLAGSFSGVGIKGIIDPVSLRRHAVEVALTGRFLCEALTDDEFKGGFTACVLHDIGKLFLIQNFPELYKRVMLLTGEMQIPVYAAEEDIFGLNHGIVGGIIAKKWNLPDSLVQAISFHHYPPEASEYQELAAIVGFADCLNHMRTADNTPETVENMAANLMNKGLIDVLQTTLGNISKEIITDKKNQVNQFLQANVTIIGSISDE